MTLTLLTIPVYDLDITNHTSIWPWHY